MDGPKINLGARGGRMQNLAVSGASSTPARAINTLAGGVTTYRQGGGRETRRPNGKHARAAAWTFRNEREYMKNSAGHLLYVLRLAALAVVLAGCTPEQVQQTGERISRAAPVIDQVPIIAPFSGLVQALGGLVLAAGVLYGNIKAVNAYRKAKGAHKRMDTDTGAAAGS